jgi:hypothetical protein
MPEHPFDRDCDCCQGTQAATPGAKFNRPALPAIAYRVGTHGDFKRSVLARLSSTDFPALAPLSTRRDDDWTIALCDAFATMGDVLSFYQERIANEAFLRTAAERRSVLELGRLVGYQLAPGVAASTHLAFTLDAPLVQPAPTPLPVTVPVGTRVQSVPGADELPQTFETTEEIVARVEWNAMPVQATLRELPHQGQRALWLEGLATGLQPGDPLLLVGAAREQNATSTAWQLRHLSSVEPDPALGRTRVSWAAPLTVFAPQGAVSADGVRAFVLRQRAALFGHNAPDANLVIPVSMPQAQKDMLVSTDAGKLSWLDYAIDSANWRLELDAPYPKLVAGSWLVLARSGATQLYRVQAVDQLSKSAYGMSGKFTRATLVAGTTLAGFTRPNSAVSLQSEELVLAEKPLRHPLYGQSVALSSVQTALQPGQQLALAGRRQRVAAPDDPAGVAFPDDPARTALPRESFIVAAAPLQVQGANTLPLDPALLEPDSGFSGRIRWTLLDHDGSTLTLEANAHVMQLQGARDDDPVVQELAQVDDAADALAHGRDRTVLRLAAALRHVYERAGARVNANVAPATHGETVGEIAGGGNAATPNQRFLLRQAPLTYVPAGNAAGRAATLAVRVNDLLWTEVPSLYAQPPGARVYALRQDDDGHTVLQFGDGIEGARLPSGTDNLRLAYRKGLGTAGHVREGTLTSLLARPLGVKAAHNPEPALGGQDPEQRDDARRNVPSTVLTLDRAVSIGDHGDFARRFAGIAKAVAVWVEGGRSRGVHLTVAGAEATPVPPGGDTHTKLYAALRAQGDALLPLKLYSYSDRRFALKARIKVDPAYEVALVLAAADAALRTAYNFDARDFGQPVTLDEVMAVLHRVAGVVAVDVDRLHFSGQLPGAAPEARLYPLPSRVQPDGSVNAAELLTLVDTGPALEVMP